MTPTRRFISDDAKIVDLCQKFEPTFMREYLMWTFVWRQDPLRGRGRLPAPVGETLYRGAGLFWEILDEEPALVQVLQTPAVRVNLETLLEETT